MKQILFFLSIVCLININAQINADTSIKDFRIIQKRVFSGYIHDVFKPSKKDSITIWTMNGKKISDDSINKRLLLFKSSELQYHKSKKGKWVALTSIMVATLTGLTGYVLYNSEYYSNPPKKLPPFGNVLLGISCTGYATAIFVMFKQMHHHHKALKMYNKKIVNSNNLQR